MDHMRLLRSLTLLYVVFLLHMKPFINVVIQVGGTAADSLSIIGLKD